MDLAPYNELLPEAVREKAMSFHQPRDRKFHLLGRLLLQYHLTERQVKSTTLRDIEYGAAHKPYFPNGPEFNISHSGDYVVCAVSTDVKMGIDLEQIARVPYQEFGMIWSPGEFDMIQSSDNPLLSFYRLWTRKEAVVKGTGLGLQIPLSSFDVREDAATVGDNRWYLKTVNFKENYSLHLATDVSSIEEPVVSFVDFKKVLG